MVLSGMIVFVIVFPVGLGAWVVARRSREPLLPPWQSWSVPWGCFEVLVGFIIITMIIPESIRMVILKSANSPEQPVNLPPIESCAALAGMPAAVAASLESEQMNSILQRFFSFPVQLSLFMLVSRVFYPLARGKTHPTVAARVRLGIVAWAILTPLVLAINMGLNLLFVLLDWHHDPQQLTRLAGRPPVDSMLFFFQVAVAAPIVEEVVFRGLFLPWALGAPRPQGIPDLPANLRPWFVWFLGLFFAWLSGTAGALLFALILLIGLFALPRLFPSKRRTFAAVYSSSAFFALVHSSVWPSPLPLFILALGLGWLAVRTRGLLVPIIVHGLFNVVSVVFVLRGGAA
jgi:membrane protease YdiL (CAAX protease family)